ncbi:MAG TPA: methylenetetrahydrofolate--tRNA-(uracil(54)-C(5))-methyltransferase (FADH(2)-oxidizing) TrmFO, partial [Geobacterales bacterium]|nr:methylenetetrahydrofolate--tRNA-(uracil(54)-C(5))-methyltransferase (FADH(2)-oxidizing) TrmFO [Geobacterales bacterium]
MKPHRFSPAHESEGLAELVCSNSLRGDALENAVGLLKEELRRLGSLVMEAAEATRVPAGGALAVDRELFSRFITERIEAEPRIELIRQEVTELPAGIVVIASGPLTSDPLAQQLRQLTGDQLAFYDAIAPIVERDSLDMEKLFRASRYGKGDGDDYLNAPLDKEEYEAFVAALLAADKVVPHDFEKVAHFEGCMPIEALASRGVETLRFGPMKPVGLVDPRTGQEPHAVVQLRQENREGTMYNLVGFQTKMTHGAQSQVFRMIPGLAQARFARLGSMHRNTFINSPRLLLPSQQLKSDPRVVFAGQITGVEGYVESTASGFLAGITVSRLVRGEEPVAPPPESAMGALMQYITTADPRHFQPMNVTYGLFPELPGRVPKKEKRRILAERALAALAPWQDTIRIR